MSEELSPKQIQILVDSGVELWETIQRATTELKLINATLVRAGLLGEQIPLNDEEREGMQFLAVGTEKTVPVVYESDPIIGQYQDGTDTQVAISEAADDKLDLFFRKQTVWIRRPKDGKQFRELAHTHLGKEAPGFITLCVARDKAGDAKSKTVVAWDRAERNAAQPQPEQ